MNSFVVKIKDVCEFVRGLTYSKSDETKLSKNAVLRATNIDLVSSRLNLSEIRYIEDSVIIPADKKVKVNDILICTASGSKSHLGKVAFINKEINMAFGGFMGVLRSKPNINPKYLFTFLKSDIFLRHILSTSNGTNINNLKFSQFENLEIVLPPLPIQQKIVVKLDKIFAEIDKAIAATEANINNVKMLFENYLNNYFDNNHDLISMPMADVCEELFAGGDVPKDRFSKLKTSKFFIPIFSNGEKNKGLYGFTDKPRVTKPSITISARGTIGYSEVRYEPFYPAIRLIVATPKTELIELDYFKYAIKICKFINSGTSIPQLTIPHIKNYIIKFPQSKEKQKILLKKMINFDLNINQIVFLNSKKLIELSKLKNSILQQAFNGELVKAA